MSPLWCVQEMPQWPFLRYAVNQLSSRQFISDKKAYISHLMHSMAHRKDGHLGLIRLCITRINKMYWNSHAILQQWQGFLIRINVKWGRSEEKWEYGHKFFLRVTPLRINYTQVHACISFFNIGKFYKNLKKNPKRQTRANIHCRLQFTK